MKVDCKAIKEKKLKELRYLVKAYNEGTNLLKLEKDYVPALNIVYDDSIETAQVQSYMKHKVNLGTQEGIRVRTIPLSEYRNNETTCMINDNPIIFQLPVAKENEEYVKSLYRNVSYYMDADMLGSEFGSKLYYINDDDNVLLPATAQGVIDILEDIYNRDLKQLEGKDICIIGRSKLVGLPLFFKLQSLNATVTLLHSKSKDIYKKIDSSDIVITAVGKENLINERNCPRLYDKDFVIIDVAFFRDSQGKLSGDVQKGEWDCIYTSVPNGVGQLTVVNLLINAMKITIQQIFNILDTMCLDSEPRPNCSLEEVLK